MARLVVLVYLLISICIQHIVHEYAHVLSARLLGERVIRIQWLTYQGGTKVFFANEPDIDGIIDRKWAIIGAAGYAATNLLAYMLIGIYYIIPNGWIKAFISVLCIILLICDSMYFAIGSMLNFGDPVGVRKALNISADWSRLLSLCGLVANIIVINYTFY